jgi:hypothetical protein
MLELRRWVFTQEGEDREIAIHHLSQFPPEMLPSDWRELTFPDLIKLLETTARAYAVENAYTEGNDIWLSNDALAFVDGWDYDGMADLDKMLGLSLIGLSFLFEPLDWGLTGFSIMRDIATGRVGPGTAFDLGSMLLPGSWSWADEATDLGRMGMWAEDGFSGQSFSLFDSGPGSLPEGQRRGDTFFNLYSPPNTQLYDPRSGEDWVLLYGGYEAGILVTRNGQVIADASIGDPTNLDFFRAMPSMRSRYPQLSDEDLRKMERNLWEASQGGFMIHNHPRGTSFSPEDLSSARAWRLSEMVAIGYHDDNLTLYRYSFSTTPDWWSYSPNDLEDLYKKVAREHSDRFEQKLLDAGISGAELDEYMNIYEMSYLQHDTLTTLAEQQVLNYKRERVMQ